MAISMEWVGEWLQNIPYSYNQVVRYINQILLSF